MKSVSIGKLKDQLSAYLARVREGEEVLVRDRDLPIARIVPLGAGAQRELLEQRLAARGDLKLPGESLSNQFWALPMPRLKRDALHRPRRRPVARRR